MAKQVLDLGTTANDGTGTPARAGGDIINDNFTELYDADVVHDAHIADTAWNAHGNQADASCGITGALTINTDLTVLNQAALGSEAILGGAQGTAVIAIKETVTSIIGQNPGMDFHMKVDGTTINAVPVGARMIGEYTGTTGFQTVSVYGAYQLGKYSGANSNATPPDSILGVLGVGAQASTDTAVTALIGVAGTVSAFASQAAITTAYNFRADSPGSHSVGALISSSVDTRPGTAIGYGFDPFFYTNVGNPTGGSGESNVYGMLVPQVSKRVNSPQQAAGIRIDDQGWNAVGSGEFHSLWINGDSEWGDIVFGLGKDAQIYYDATNLVINPKLVGSGYVDIKGGLKTAGKRIKKTTVTTGATYQILVTDHVVFYDTDLQASAATMPAGAEGQTIKVINAGVSGNDLTVDGSGSEKLMGLTTVFTLSDGNALELTYNATHGWY